MKELGIIVFIVFSLGLAGCGQSVSSVSITPRTPSSLPYEYNTSTDLAGSISTPSTSAQYSLSVGIIGTTTSRTMSSSASFKLVSGIGAD